MILGIFWLQFSRCGIQKFTKYLGFSYEERIFQPRNSDDMTQKKAKWIRFIPPSDVGYESNETVVPFSPEAESNIKIISRY